jgi:hypothetical protein
MAARRRTKVNMEFAKNVAAWAAENWQALVGYGASVVILVSLVTANVLKLRLVNGIGSLLFGWYGLLIGSWPVCIINWIIAGIDGWFLAKTLAAQALFDLEPARGEGAAYLRRFFLYHERELAKFTPGVTLAALEGAETHLLFRNLLPVGLFSYRKEGDKGVILADYMVPEYRDFKAGRFLYRVCRMRFKEAGVREFLAEGAGRQQVKYYLKNGFRRVEAEGGGERYVLEL